MRLMIGLELNRMACLCVLQKIGQLLQKELIEMAKRSKAKVNMSQLVRDYQAAHPNASAKEVADAVGAKPSLVYNLRSNEKKKGTSASRVRKAVRGTVPSNASSDLDAAVEFIEKVGGLSNAARIIESLQRLSESIS